MKDTTTEVEEILQETEDRFVGEEGGDKYNTKQCN